VIASGTLLRRSRTTNPACHGAAQISPDAIFVLRSVDVE
jgi:hypothetical protein